MRILYLLWKLTETRIPWSNQFQYIVSLVCLHNLSLCHQRYFHLCTSLPLDSEVLKDLGLNVVVCVMVMTFLFVGDSGVHRANNQGKALISARAARACGDG